MEPERAMRLLKEDVKDESSIKRFEAILPRIVDGKADLIFSSLEPPEIEGFAVVEEIERAGEWILHVVLMVGIEPTIERLIEACKVHAKRRNLAGVFMLKEV